jgi:transposase
VKKMNELAQTEEIQWWDDGTGNEPSPEIIQRRQNVAVCWNRKGMTIAETAQHLGVGVATVSRDRAWLLKVWRNVVRGEITSMVGRELKKYEDQEAELWEAWENSKDPQLTRKIERMLGEPRGDDEDAEPGIILKETVQTKQRDPDPRYMDQILKIQERRARLLGLDKAAESANANFNFAEFVSNAYEMALQNKGLKEVDGKIVPMERIEEGEDSSTWAAGEEDAS